MWGYVASCEGGEEKGFDLNGGMGRWVSLGFKGTVATHVWKEVVSSAPFLTITDFLQLPKYFIYRMFPALEAVPFRYWFSTLCCL